jgi:hypothetical protein
MGVILHIKPGAKAKGASLPKHTYQSVEDNKYVDYLSVSGWLNSRKKSTGRYNGRKYCEFKVLNPK